MTAKFVGTHEHSLDAKGRVILPVKFRGQYPNGAFLTTDMEGCLSLWSPAEYERESDRLKDGARTDRAQRNHARYWFGNTSEVEIDRQGRMPISPYLRRFARLESDVLVIGTYDRVEFWNPQVWAEKVSEPEERLFLGEDDDPAGSRDDATG